MILPYVSFGPGHPPRPGASIVLYTTAGQRCQAMPALIDSGCDRSNLPFSFAEALGVDLSGVEGEQSSQGTVFTSNVPILGRIGDLAVPLQPDFLQHFIPNRNMVCLGRRDFFAAYVVTFDEDAQTVELTPSAAPLQAHMRPFAVPV